MNSLNFLVEYVLSSAKNVLKDLQNCQNILPLVDIQDVTFCLN